MCTILFGSGLNIVSSVLVKPKSSFKLGFWIRQRGDLNCLEITCHECISFKNRSYKLN